MKKRVPVIDIAPLAAGSASRSFRTTARELGQASAEWGVFQVIEHGIPAVLVGRLEQQMRAFFALPEAHKLAVRRSERNALGFYAQELTKNTPDWKEVFDLGPVAAPDLLDDHPANSGLDGHNRWPEGLPGFRAVMLEYWNACERLSQRLLEALCVGLELPADRLERHFQPRHTSFLRLNHYPPCDDPAAPDSPDLPSRGTMGVNYHSDAGALTVLVQHGSDGLQVRCHGQWSLLEAVDGAFIINLGDMLQVWSNDRYRAPQHRVLASRQGGRISAPFFFNPAAESVCAPLDELVDADHPPRYRPVPWGPFRLQRAGGDYADIGTEIQISQFRTDPSAG